MNLCLPLQAEGVQSFFNSNAYSDPPNGIHNNISTREALKSYDPELHAFIEEFFPCNNTYIHRCDNDRGKDGNSMTNKGLQFDNLVKVMFYGQQPTDHF